MAKETLHQQPKNRLYLLVTLVMFLIGCAVVTQPTPTDIAPVPPTETRPIPSPTFTPVPSATAPARNPLQQSLDVLRAVSSVRIQTTYYDSSVLEPTTPLWTTEMWYRPGPPEVLHTHSDWGEGLVSELICQEQAEGEQCWSQVGQHPWTHRSDPSSISTWLEQLRQAVTSTTIVSSTILPESNQLLVTWRRPLLYGVPSAERWLIG